MPETYFSWLTIKQRIENQPLNNILFGTFTVLTSTLFYRYALLQSNEKNEASLINVNQLFLCAVISFLSAALRYVGQFTFLHTCPPLIQSHTDLDGLLKIAKDTLIEENDWINVSTTEIREWNTANYSRRSLRIIIATNEVVIFVIFVVGLSYFFLSLKPLLSHLLLGR